MRKTLIFLAGAALASSYWVAILYGKHGDGGGAGGLWAFPAIGTLAVVTFAVAIALEEQD